jgi:hypothetical protein
MKTFVYHHDNAFPREYLNVSKYTVHTQKNGAVSKVDKEIISHPTRGQHTLSTAGIAQFSDVLPAIRFSCLLRSRGTSFQDAVAAGQGFCVLRFEVSRSVITVQHEFRAWFKTHYSCVVCFFLNHERNSRCTTNTDLNTSKWSTQKASCCDAILKTGLAALQ